jgi:hypothetical protein
MIIERPHTLGTEAAKQKLDAFIDELLGRPIPAGVEVGDVQKRWAGNRLEVSARVRKGFMATTVSGTLDVTDDRVIVATTLPPAAAMIVGEERIRQGISDRIDALLAGS